MASVSYASIILIAFSTIPSISRLTKRRRVKPANDSNLYEDADGVATEESMARYSTNHFYIITLVLATIGVATSLALAIYTTLQRHNFSHLCLVRIWLLFPSWVRS
jgi:hypothetical protein